MLSNQITPSLSGDLGSDTTRHPPPSTAGGCRPLPVVRCELIWHALVAAPPTSGEEPGARLSPREAGWAISRLARSPHASSTLGGAHTTQTSCSRCHGMADFSSTLVRAGFWIEHALAPHPAWQSRSEGIPRARFIHACFGVPPPSARQGWGRDLKRGRRGGN